MQPLTIDDLLPLEEYVVRRREYFDSHRRYIDKYRRVRVGPRLTLIFENRQTLWFRVQEIIRIARLSSPDDVQQELDLYNRLLPGKDILQAALLIDMPTEAELIKELPHWQSLHGDQLWLRVGNERFGARLVTCRPEDRCIGTAHWVQFHLKPENRRVLADLSLSAQFAFDNDHYKHQSGPLSEDLRLSLVDDLKLSERQVAQKAA